MSDTGVGMEEETRARAIKPFFSTKGIGQGSGLGLSIFHGLAAQFGGAHDPKQTVLGHCPRMVASVAANLASVPERGPDTETSTGVRNALVINDEDLVRMSTAEMLADLGYEVMDAISAEARCGLLRTAYGQKWC